ncbi:MULTISPECIES: DUF2922 domain-containing protein [Pontibacillus]|uniref:DUF2922 domain-containing protein n=1 Tax=Pontibacillus chungwhensis TaxID=265426 RepID=A0ABY8V0R4_9BACI|nr:MULTISPECIES: DUF2922 domain-containing protein [Pontibacillus]MCD5324367.1 DUF2922 domain-containing protein [Pontibacillus sp. HN14]WIF99334.1 DUF2922 domain-containing protein [Pontibacillus chungwhensis]
MAKKLEMKFENELGRTVTISLDDPVEPVDVVQLNAAMDEIVAQNCFTSSGGELLSKKEARIVERNVADIEL